MSTSEQAGPQPTRNDRPRDAALRVLRQLVATGGPATLSALHERLGGHPNTVRQHLEHLVADGFADEVHLPARGRGRPALAWTATVAGTQIAQEDPERGLQNALVEAVAEHLATTADPVRAARSLGSAWGRRLVGPGDADLLAVLAAQGFAPQRLDDVIALRACPLLASATRRPEIVCGIHQGLIDAVSDGPARLVPFARPGACLVEPR